MGIIAEEVVQAATDLVDTVSAEKTFISAQISLKVLGGKGASFYWLLQEKPVDKRPAHFGW